MSAVTGQVSADHLLHAEEVVRSTADIDDVFARRHVVLAHRVGTVAVALSRGDVDALARGLRSVAALCLAWVAVIEEER